jgi:drug/metabolite transporter (DMT)-like permease
MSMPGPPQSALHGILWMVAATGFQAAASGTVRQLSAEIGVAQLLFFHGVIGFVLMLPLVARLPPGSVRRARFRAGLYGARALLSFLGMLVSFYAYSRLDIASVQALQFTTPLFTIMLASLILGELVGLRGWLSCLIGFVGALIIIRPGLIALNLGAVAALGSAVAFAAANVVIRRLAATENPVLITIVSNMIIAPLALIPALFDWTTPEWRHVPWILAMGTLFMMAQLCLTYSIGAADARIVQSINFLRLPWAVLVGWVLFAELPDLWTWIGALVIFAGAWEVLRRERRAGAPARRTA